MGEPQDKVSKNTYDICHPSMNARTMIIDTTGGMLTNTISKFTFVPSCPEVSFPFYNCPAMTPFSIHQPYYLDFVRRSTLKGQDVIQFFLLMWLFNLSYIALIISLWTGCFIDSAKCIVPGSEVINAMICSAKNASG
jgi:hypothetical protein